MNSTADNLRSTNYSHQCGDIFVKIARKKSNSASSLTSDSKSKKKQRFFDCTCIKGRLRSSKTKEDQRLAYQQTVSSELRNTLFSSNDQLDTIKSSNDQLNTTKSSNDQLNTSKSFNDQAVDKSRQSSSSKERIHVNDQQTNVRSIVVNSKSESNHKSRSKEDYKSTSEHLESHNDQIDCYHLIDKKANSTEQIASIKTNSNNKDCSSKESNKKQQDKHSTKNFRDRKRSDIENIFDLNAIKRVKSEMSSLRRPLVFCGPSGSGKSTLLKKLRADFPDYFGFSISHTTREPRAGEVHGQDYYYVSKEEMVKAIENNEFIENAEFSGNIYGTSKKAVEDVRSRGKICILDIEIEGVKNVKKSNLNPVYIFIKPPNVNELENRLRKRGSETEENIQKRLRRAHEEIEFGEMKDNFDLLLVNDDFDSTYNKLKCFVLECYGLPDTSELQVTIEKPDEQVS